MQRIFLLSPAFCGGKRARLVLNPGSSIALARRLHTGQAVAIGELFSFLSSLYFRGKLAYANAFANPPKEHLGAYVITPDRGLLSLTSTLTLAEVRAFSAVPIDEKEP